MTFAHCILAITLAHGGMTARDSLPPDLVKDAKGIITFLRTGHADSVQARMTPEAQRRFTAAQRDSLWHVLVSQVGDFRRFGASHVEQGQDGTRTVILELDFAAEPLRGSVAYDSTGRISSVVFQSQ